MYASFDDFTRTGSARGPAVYLGYCTRTNRYRMMDLPDYLSNMQRGMSQWVSDTTSIYQDAARGYYAPGTGGSGVRVQRGHDCGCGSSDRDCHCECCIEDADVLVHARCGEVRRIPVTFENDTRREREVKLVLEPFKTAGGRELGWPAQLSEAGFTLRACDEHTITIAMQVRCDQVDGGKPSPNPTGTAPPLTHVPAEDVAGVRDAATPRLGGVDRCEVAYATLRADGCQIRPIVVAVAVLPDDCDAYRKPCACGCCH